MHPSRLRRLWWGLLGLPTLFLLPSESSAAPLYSITDLGTLPGTTQSIATGINNSGQVVGVSYNTVDNQYSLNPHNPSAYALSQPIYDPGARSFLFSNGSLSTTNPTGGLATAINDSGQVIGGQNVAINNSGDYVSFDATQLGGTLNSGGHQTQLGYGFYPRAISENGTIAGAVVNQGTPAEAVIRTPDGKSTILGSWQAETRIDAINKKGDMLLNAFSTVTGFNSTLIVNGGNSVGLTDLSGGKLLVAAALNNSDQVVGGGLLYSNGTIYTLSSLIPPTQGWSNLNATGINDAGQIVGQGTINGQNHAFLMTPQNVPEPGTWFVMAVFAAYGWTKTRSARKQARRAV